MQFTKIRPPIIGYTLVISSLLFGISFEFFNHIYFWNSAYIIVALITLSTVIGGLLVGGHVSKKTIGHKWMRSVGIFFIAIFAVSMLTAIALTFPGVNYLSSNFDYISWDTYQGDYVVGLYALRLLQLGVMSGLIGSIMISLKQPYQSK
jgi:MFS family permease